MVLVADTIVNPRAMMIHAHHTTVAKLAMLDPWPFQRPAGDTNQIILARNQRIRISEQEQNKQQ
jgi:hypothetical protein